MPCVQIVYRVGVTTNWIWKLEHRINYLKPFTGMCENTRRPSTSWEYFSWSNRTADFKLTPRSWNNDAYSCIEFFLMYIKSFSFLHCKCAQSRIATEVGEIFIRLWIYCVFTNLVINFVLTQYWSLQFVMGCYYGYFLCCGVLLTTQNRIISMEQFNLFRFNSFVNLNEIKNFVVGEKSVIYLC